MSRSKINRITIIPLQRMIDLSKGKYIQKKFSIVHIDTIVHIVSYEIENYQVHISCGFVLQARLNQTNI